MLCRFVDQEKNMKANGLNETLIILVSVNAYKKEKCVDCRRYKEKPSPKYRKTLSSRDIFVIDIWNQILVISRC